MRGRSRFRSTGAVVTLLILLAGMVMWVLAVGGVKHGELAAASDAARRNPNGSAQLISQQALPSTEGELCQWAPASAETTLMAALQQSTQSAAADAAQEGGTSEGVNRAPVRVIRDTFPTYSAVAVDTNSNEVYLLDENLFGYKVFNRKDNTPPTAAFTEPKRIVQGVNTHLEFNCGLYIDPQSGDVYSVNNDTQDVMVVFPRDAEGNAVPERKLETPHRTWGIAVDEKAQELYLSVQHPPEVVVYHKTADKDDKPLRVLSGPQTKLEDAHGIALDTLHQWMFVVNHGSTSNPATPGGGNYFPPSITVYPLKASGDTPPLRTIQGSNTQLDWPGAMALDQQRGELYVANDMGNSILVFQATAEGNAAPIRVIKGPKTGIMNPTGIFLDMKNNEIWLSNMGNHTATVYSRTANGDVAPLRTIRSSPLGMPAQMIGNPGAAGYDSKREEILVPN
jgi:hypothetical protein